MRKNAIGVVFFVCVVLAGPLSAQYTVLHHFTGGTTDGRWPFESPVCRGSLIYGMTEFGGAHGAGVIYKIKKDGTGFAVLHSFSGGTADGSYPRGTLILKGNVLYGMTRWGGASDNGTIFKINVNGTGFKILHSFAGGPADGFLPCGALAAKGAFLYGMTSDGGTSNLGTIFKIKKNGAGYAVLHSFADDPADGHTPERGSLAVKGTQLFGMTQNGGASDGGTLFRISTTGLGFTLLHSFTGWADGALPLGSVVIKGTVLYGMAPYGGANSGGVIFSANLDGTGFAVLYDFPGALPNGSHPYGSLVFCRSVAYGTTAYGGSGDFGTIFKFNLEDGSLETLHEFAGPIADGSHPSGSLAMKNGVLYGMSRYGGASDTGILFSFSTK